MKVILVNGSPHEKGCTYTALLEIEGTLNKNNIDEEVELAKALEVDILNAAALGKNKVIWRS